MFETLNHVARGAVFTNTPIADWDRARMMVLQVTGYRLGARSDEVRNSRSGDRHESMKIEMKKEKI